MKNPHHFLELFYGGGYEQGFSDGRTQGHNDVIGDPSSYGLSIVKCIYTKGSATINYPEFGGITTNGSASVLTLPLSVSGDYTCDVGQILETYVVENCTHIEYTYSKWHDDGQASLFIDGVKVADKSSYSGDLTKNLHTITVRQDSETSAHHAFYRGFSFTFD